MRFEILSQIQASREEQKQVQEQWETQYKQEIPYLEQTLSWREGMRYRYSPDSYLISLQEYLLMTEAGAVIGQALETIFSRIFEFRLDFIKDRQNQLFITEIQTDDRGLPAVAIARNARGKNLENPLPGVILSFLEAIQGLKREKASRLVIIYPEDEYFYYTGFIDFSRICKAYVGDFEVLVASKKDILNLENNLVAINYPNGFTLKASVDYFWDFTETIESNLLIQPRVNKDILLQTWDDSTPAQLQCLRKFIPLTLPPQSQTVIEDKDSWVLKPIEGRWSQEVVFGRRVEQRQWEEIISQSEGCLAQQFIKPKIEWFNTRQKNGFFQNLPYVGRIEGYYFKIGSAWVLADTLTTLTDDLPVHGKRSCLMLPGEISANLPQKL